MVRDAVKNSLRSQILEARSSSLGWGLYSKYKWYNLKEKRDVADLRLKTLLWQLWFWQCHQLSWTNASIWSPMLSFWSRMLESTISPSEALWICWFLSVLESLKLFFFNVDFHIILKISLFSYIAKTWPWHHSVGGHSPINSDMRFIWFPFTVGTIWPAVNESKTVEPVFIPGSIFASMCCCDYLHFHFSVRFYNIREHRKKPQSQLCRRRRQGEKRGFVASRHECNGFIQFHQVQQWWVWANGEDKPSTSPLLLPYMEGEAPETWPFSASLCLLCATLPEPRVPTFPSKPDLHICTEAVLRVLTLNFAHGLASANPAPAERKHTVLSTPAKPFLLTPSDLFKIQGLSTLTSLDKIQACVYILVPSPAYFSGLPMRVKGNHRIQAPCKTPDMAIKVSE